jgi:hypothetical protein
MPAGFEARAAFVKEATPFVKLWPSTQAAVATTLIPLLTEGVNQAVEYQSITEENNRNVPSLPIIMSQHVRGPLAVDARYQGLDFLIACVMGYQARKIGATDMPESLGGGAYRHLWETDENLRGEPWRAGDGFTSETVPELLSGQQKLRRGTYVVNKATDVWECRSCMLGGLTIEANGSGVTFVTDLIGHDMALGSVVGNDLTSFTCNTEPISFLDMKFYISNTAPLIFDSTDELVELAGFNIDISNNLSTLFTMDTGSRIDEPDRNGSIEVSGSFGIPTYLSSGFRLENALLNDTELIGCLEFIGPVIGGGNNFTLRIWLPSMKLTDVTVDVAGPQQMQMNHAFVATKPASNPSGFPDNLKGGPIMIELINDNATNPLL